MSLKLLSPLHKATRQIGVHLESRFSEIGVGGTEAHLLTFLGSYAPCTINQLHRVFGLKRSTLTSILDRLEERELIRRELDTHDRRSVQVVPTAVGRRVARRLSSILEVFEKEIGDSLSPRDWEGFQAVMSAIARNSFLNRSIAFGSPQISVFSATFPPRRRSSAR